MNDRLIRQRGFFFGMVLILAVLALILVWQFVQAILLALALVVILQPMYNWFLERKWIKGNETLALVTFDSGVPKAVRGSLDPRIEAHVYAAMVMGVRDYVGKNRFPGVLLGLSGGVDSALTLAIAVDALGPARVRAVMLPSRYTRSISLEDAREMAGLLGVRYDEFSIDPMFSAFLGALAGEFRNLAPDAAEENIQARIRGTVLMALSNKFGSIVLTTGNKSEMAVGYATLYGREFSEVVMEALDKGKILALAPPKK